MTEDTTDGSSIDSPSDELKKNDAPGEAASRDASDAAMAHSARRRRLGVGFWAGILLLIAALGLGPGRKHTMLGDSIQTAGHFLAFGVLCLATTWGVRPFLPATFRWRLVSALLGLFVAVLAGGMVEYAQKMLPGRDASWQDLAKDAQGAMAVLCLVGLAGLLRDQRSSDAKPAVLPRLLAGLLLSGMLAWFLLLGLLPTVRCAWDYWQRGTERSELMPLEQPWVKRFLWADEGVRVDLVPPPAEWPLWETPRVAELTIAAGDGFPGFGMREVAPDWRNHASFVFEVRNASDEPLDLGFRIHDVHHDNDYYDRFNATLHLAPGDQTIRIPLAEVERGPRRRRLDMRHIEGFKLMALRPPRELRLFVSGFRLE
jgi:VanZ family protein